MNGLAAALGELGALKDGLAALQAGSGAPACDVLVCPPATLIAQAAWKVQGAFALGGQDCHAKASGAFTGDLSAEMLKDAGATYVILGHSERRQYHGESDAEVSAKVQGAWRAGLKAVICIGETEAQREAGTHNSICSGQLDGSVPDGATGDTIAIAYEPVWAIGTGKTPTEADISAVHAAMRAQVGGTTRLLYGGSMKPANAAAILALPNVDGGLIGGAALVAADFLGVAKAAG